MTPKDFVKYSIILQYNSGLFCQAIIVLAYPYLSKPEVSHLVSPGPFIINYPFRLRQL